MSAQMRNIDVIANNIANVSTTAFKRQMANFEDLFYQELNIAGGSAGASRTSPIGSQIGTGVRLVGIQRIFTLGMPKETQNPYDVMIQGRGFIAVDYDGTNLAYTRAGNFHVDAEGDLVTADGRRLNDKIRIPLDATNVQISVTGEVTAKMPGQAQPRKIGDISLYTFPNSAGLSAIGDSLFMESGASGQARQGNPGESGYGILRQGSLESSNVDVVNELVAMIEGQRAYEINANSIKTADDMLQVANNLRG